MNIRRGLFRLWLLASVAWVGLVWAFYQGLTLRSVAASEKACADARIANPALGNPFDCFASGGRNFDDLNFLSPIPLRYLALGLGAPVAILLIGVVLIWALRGFRRDG